MLVLVELIVLEVAPIPDNEDDCDDNPDKEPKSEKLVDVGCVF